MEKIMLAVGKLCPNKYSDVCIVQTLLNENLHILPTLKLLSVDGNCGKKTIDAIEQFQKSVVKMTVPDGKVDPHGKTLSALNAGSKNEKSTLGVNVNLQAQYCFPLAFRPTQSYKEGMRRFGASRSGGRLHAGCDLYAPVGTAVYAIDDGVVFQDLYAFYLGTNALEIKHSTFVARYGELKNVLPEVKKGEKIKKGQLLGYVGQLQGLNMSMLHLEVYSGAVSGPLTVRANRPYQRRADLMDPTLILDKAISK